MYRLLLAVWASALLSCAQPEPRRAGTYLSKEELAACIGGGGRAEQARYALEVCATPTTDAGKPCADRRDCQGFCEAPFNAQKDQEVTGQCSKASQSVPTG